MIKQLTELTMKVNKKSEYRDFMGMGFTNSKIISSKLPEQEKSLKDEIKSCTEVEHYYGGFIYDAEAIKGSVINLKNLPEFYAEVIIFDFDIKAKYLFLTLTFKNGNKMKLCFDLFNMRDLLWILKLLELKRLVIKFSESDYNYVTEVPTKKLTELENKFRTKFNSNELFFTYLLSLYLESNKDLTPKVFLNKMRKEVSECLQRA